MSDDIEKAKSLLLGAIDAALRIASHSPSSQEPVSSEALDETSCGTANLPSNIPLPRSSPNTAYNEHRRLFGYQSFKGKGKGKGSAKGSKKPAPKRLKQPKTWTKDVICLRERDHSWRPSTVEKMDLAKVGLGLKRLSFDIEGTSQHIHDKIIETYPSLMECGGYTLLRLSDSSANLIEIEDPDTGLNVMYLKDILQQAKLYIRPLQTDITDDVIKVS